MDTSYLALTVTERWGQLRALQIEYKEFNTFLYDVISGLMGFNCTANQLDMGEYLQRGPLFRMIQAQRGQAKTTVTAAYAVWRLIHDPSTRILIISAGDKMAKEISNWIIQIISGMDELACLRPDRNRGDRASVEAYDVHCDLKGPEKSPSVACVGITSNLQGKRADVLIADDVESQKNAATAEMRDRLTHLTRDFTSICSKGDIIYLGTPQSVESIYNGLPSRGFDIRIWPGRYPTEDEVGNYGQFLAPLIKEAMEQDPSLRTGGGMTGLRGKPTDNVILGEETLLKKEIDQGAAYFQLQHMLDTRLADQERFPLKISKLVFMDVPEATMPIQVNFMAHADNKIQTPTDYPIHDFMYSAASFGPEFGKYQGTHMYVDPAGGGQNGDETAYAVTKFIAGKVVLVDIGGVSGGVGEDALDALTAIAVKWKPHQIDIEKNFGNGALSQIWSPKLFSAMKAERHSCAIEDVWESGQKELRIIDTLEPIIGSHRLIVDQSLIEQDWKSVQSYPAEKRASYSLFAQISRITRDRGALYHDDRLDALAGSARHWLESLAQDEVQAQVAAQRDAYREMMQNPLGDGRPMPGYESMYGLGNNLNALSALKRRW